MELLERDQQLRQLEDGLVAAIEGDGSTALVYGEAGIGKTRLANEFLATASDRARVLWSACDDLITAPPLGPFRELARQFGGDVAAVLEGGAAQAEFFSVVVEALDSPGDPTVLVVEDAHWADAASLDGLKYLGRRIGRLPAQLVITYRDDEVPPDHALRYVLGDLPPDTVRRIPLEPLSPDAVARLAREAGYTAAEVITASRGNPFLLTEYLSSGGARVPASVLDSISVRLARCSAGARDVLAVISVVPGRCERSLFERSGGAAAAALEECRDRGLIDFDGAAAWFRHELARRAAEELLGAEQWRSTHASVLDALIAADADISRIVHHAEAAADVEALVRFGPRAARQAEAAAAHHEALSHYRRIMPYLDRFSDSERADLLTEFAVESYLADDQPPALEAAVGALELRRSLGDRRGEGELLRWLSRLHWWHGDKAEADRFADDAIRVLEELGPSPELAMAYSNVSLLHMLAHSHEPAVAWAMKAITVARYLGDLPTLVHALNNLGSARVRVGDLGGGELLLESLDLARDLGLDEQVARALSNLSWTALDYRDYARAEQFIEEGLTHTLDKDLAGSHYYLMSQRARFHLERGDWDAAEADARWVLQRPRSPGITTLPALTVLARVQSRRGDPGAAASLDAADAAAREMGEFQRMGPVAVARAEHAWLHGDTAGIAAALQPIRGTSLRERQPWISDEIDFWWWRGGGEVEDAEGLVAPFRLHLEGDLRGAAAQWALIGCPFEQAAALADADHEASLLEALEIFTGLGSIPAAALVRRRLRSIGASRIPRGPYRRTRENPAGLTARQVEVLRLVAEGLSNAAIADRLFVTPKTVEHHVSAILTKLGVEDRDAAAVAARDLGLTGSAT